MEELLVEVLEQGKFVLGLLQVVLGLVEEVGEVGVGGLEGLGFGGELVCFGGELVVVLGLGEGLGLSLIVLLDQLVPVLYNPSEFLYLPLLLDNHLCLIPYLLFQLLHPRHQLFFLPLTIS